VKNKVLYGLLIIVTAWALIVSGLYWRLQQHPKIIAFNSERQAGDIERIRFLRQFIERYFTYDSGNFWQTQTSLAALLSPDLRETRLNDIQRLRDKVSKKNISQTVNTQWIEQTQKDHFLVHVQLLINEEARVNAISENIDLNLQDTERTLENPWGLLVSLLDFTVGPRDLPMTLQMRPGSSAIVTLPCAVESFQNPATPTLTAKITTFNISEVQLSLIENLKQPVQLVALCKDLEFHWTVQQSLTTLNVFEEFPSKTGSARIKESKTPVHKKDAYDKTIENVLGVKVDN